MSDTIEFLDSITDVIPASAGRVAVSGSHGGLYPASIASRAGLAGIVFNDAGGGFENAGAAGIFALDDCGMAAITADCMSCLIGDARDTFENGIVSQENIMANGLGIEAGMAVKEAVAHLLMTPMPIRQMPALDETRTIVQLHPNGAPILTVDSASLVGPDDAGQIIVTGSHGGLIGGNPNRALKALAKLAVFNDAGIGKDAIGLTRLPALNDRGVAAMTVSHDSCRIGDAGSMLETGVISQVNKIGQAMGARIGDPLTAFLRSI